MDWSPPSSSVHGILQARILEWVAMPSSRGNFPSPGIKPASPTSNLCWQSRSLTLASLWHVRQTSGSWYNFQIHWFSCDPIAQQGGSLWNKHSTISLLPPSTCCPCLPLTAPNQEREPGSLWMSPHRQPPEDREEKEDASGGQRRTCRAMISWQWGPESARTQHLSKHDTVPRALSDKTWLED